MYAFTYEDVRTPANRQRQTEIIIAGASMSLNGCKNLLSQLQSIIWSRSERKNAPSASLFDVDLTHPFLLANDLDLIAYFVCETNAGGHSFDENKG